MVPELAREALFLDFTTAFQGVNNGGFPRYVLNQLKIFVPVGKDIKIVTPVK